MNWEAVGALAELLGAGGVIITLAILARQIMQNTRAVRASTSHALTTQSNEINLRLGLDPIATELLSRGARSRDDLEPHEYVRYTLLMRAVIGNYQDMYVQFRAGMCENETWEVMKLALGQSVSAPSFAAFWERNRELFDSGFRSEVDTLLRAT